MPINPIQLKRLIAVTQHLIDSTITESTVREYEQLLSNLKAELSKYE